MKNNMNKHKFFLTLQSVVLLVLTTISLPAYATSGTTTKQYFYYAKVFVHKSGNGKVYASTSSLSLNDVTWGDSIECGPIQDTNDYGSSAPSTGSAIFYLYAKAEEGYKFDGWSESNERPSSFLSEETSFIYQAPITKPTATVTAAPSNKINATEKETNNSGDKTEYYSGTTTTKLYAYFSEKVNVTITFEPAIGGTYTYSCADGSETISTEAQSVTTKEEVTLVANPDTGNKFYGWYTLNGTEENYFSYSATFAKTFSSNTTIYAKFIPAEAAIYTIKGTDIYFYDLNAAITAAQSSTSKVIVPTVNGTILAGNYTIPSGVTLLVPFNAEYTTYGASVKQVNSRTTPSEFRTLTLASDVVLNVNGTIEIGGYQSVAGQHKQACGGMESKYGELIIPLGAKININNGAYLYVWGIVSGKGEIIAKNGAKVYESFIITDYKGGTITTNLVSASIFPLSQYYVQNVQVPMTIEYGAIVNTYTGLTANSTIYDATIKLIGTGSGAMFIMQTGSKIVKEYDCATDRQIYTIDGDASLNDISLSVAGTSVASSDYTLPITNNMTVNIRSGKTILKCNTIELTSDAEINIMEGAEAEIASGKKMAVIDLDQWGNYPGDAYIYPLANAYAPHRTGTRTAATMHDAKIYVRGQFTVIGGLYTSDSGANICSDNTSAVKGKIILQSAAPSSNISVKHKTGTSGSSLVNANVSCSAAKLHNDSIWYKDGLDCEYLATSGCGANTTITYANGHWGWMEVWKDYDGTILKAINTISQSSNGTAPSNPTRDCYAFSSWNTSTDTENQEVVHVATYTPTCAIPTYTITWKNYDGTVLETDTDVEENANPTYDGETPTRPSTAQYTYTFNNTWSPAVVPATEDAVYTAQYDSTVNTFTVRFLVDGEVYDTQTVEYGSNATTPTDPTKTGYTFTGWDKSLNNITANTDINAQFNINSYEITFKNADGTTLSGEGYTGSYEYNSTLNPTDPTMAATDKYTFTFREWQPALQPVISIATYTAVYDTTINKYTIRFVNWDGTELQSGEVEYDVIPTYEGATPTKDSTAQYTYTFAGWTPTIVAVKGDATYIATYDSTLNTYGGFTFSSSDPVAGTVSVNPEKSEYEYGETVTVTATPNEGYEFVGWSDGSTEGEERVITIDETTTDVQALFTAKTDIKYTVKHWQQNIVDDDYTEITADEQESRGTTATLTQVEPNTYIGFVALTIEQKYIAANGSTVVNVYYNRQIFEVKFVVEEVAVQIDSLRYEALPQYNGETPTKPSTAQYTYTFDKWTPEIVAVTEDTTYTATFTSTVNKYLITFVDEDGTELQSGEVEYGEKPAYSGETPTKEEDETNWYVFSGWTPEIAEVAGEQTYTAVYQAIDKSGATGLENAEYTITISGHTIIVRGINVGTKLFVYDAQGNMVTYSESTSDMTTINVPANGLYIVRVANRIEKVLINR